MRAGFHHFLFARHLAVQRHNGFSSSSIVTCGGHWNPLLQLFVMT
jgi:hypothetical protein